MELSGNYEASKKDAIWFYYDQEEIGQVCRVFPIKWWQQRCISFIIDLQFLDLVLAGSFDCFGLCD